MESKARPVLRIPLGRPRSQMYAIEAPGFTGAIRHRNVHIPDMSQVTDEVKPKQRGQLSLHEFSKAMDNVVARYGFSRDQVAGSAVNSFFV